MKKIVKLIICCLLFVNIFGINNVVYADKSPSIEIRIGDKVTYYVSDRTQVGTMQPTEGSAIEGLNVGYDINEGDGFFVLTPTKDLDLNNFFLNANYNVRFVLDNDITITSEIEYPEETVSFHVMPGVIYINGILEVYGNHSLTINYSVDEKVYDDLPFETALTAIYADNFVFLGTDTAKPTININECTDEEIVKDRSPMIIGAPIFCLDNNLRYKSPLIKNATVNIQSYAYGIVSQTFIRTDNAVINLLRLGYRASEPSYTGIYCEGFCGNTLANTKLTIKEDENCGTSSAEKSYGLFADVSSDVNFENCKLDIDLSTSNGLALGVGSDSNPCVFKFLNTYADVKGYVSIPYGAILITGNSNTYFSSNIFTLETERTGSAIQIADEDGHFPTVLFETTNEDCLWSKGFVQFYGFDNALGATECYNWTEMGYFNEAYSDEYKLVTIRKNCTVTYEGLDIAPLQTASFMKIPQPNEPSGHEDQDFQGWYYVDRFGDEVRFDFDDYVRCDMNLYPKWAEKGIDSFELNNASFDFINFNLDYDGNYDSYYYNLVERYGFKDGECTYYSSLADSYIVYNNQTGQMVDNELDVAFGSDTFVYEFNISLQDTSRVFNDDTVVKVNGKVLPKLTKKNVIDKDSLGSFDESNEGYYISPDGTSITLQLVSAVPEAYYVDTLKIEHDGFDFKTYNIDLRLPEKFELFNGNKLITLVKDGDPTYFIVIMDGMKEIMDINGKTLKSIDEINPDKVDSAVVLFNVEPKSFGPLFNDSSKVIVNNDTIKHTNDESMFVGMEGGFEGKITKDVEVCMVNEDGIDELIVQLYFSTDSPSPTPDPHHDPGHTPSYIIPATGIK